MHEEVIPYLNDLQAWRSHNNNESIKLFDYAGMAGSPDLFFAYSEVFVPELVMRYDRPFLKTRFSESTFESWLESEKSHQTAQKMMNLVSVRVLIQGDDIVEQHQISAAETLRNCWLRSIRVPNVTVEIWESDAFGPGVTFWT